VFVDVVEDVRENEVDLAEKPVAVEFEAEVRQVKSMADGTYNIVLNVPEYCLPQVQTMMGWLKDLVRVVMAESDKFG
jgi:hypothetical protein